ncbi:unnamed protein product [Rhizoctonia solani]|uniref:Lysine-specific metallo-endopeptidase domain-containing protein n=1 Tax=Rhizoctonia solani TaxID=456999 RepID=A0A8H2XU20_9AGAM|nr:unnamed protein product [Rhizoctonia solani]
MKGKATSLTYDCNVCKVTAGKQFLAMDAYVSLASEPRTINLCGKFWDTPVTGTPSRAGVIVRALSQFPENGWVTDHIIDKPKVLELAAVDPGNAVFNAENHRYL